MAHLSKVNGQGRLRYRVTFPHGWADRSRRYKIVREGQRKLSIAHQLEYKTREGHYKPMDIEEWRVSRLINNKDTQLLAASIGLKGADELLGPGRIKEIKINAVNEFIIDMFDFNPEKKDIPSTLRLAILNRDKTTCQVCGRGMGEVSLEIDHIIPCSKGGKTTPFNLQTLCKKCNISKKNRYSFHFNKQKMSPHDYGYEIIG